MERKPNSVMENTSLGMSEKISDISLKDKPRKVQRRWLRNNQNQRQSTQENSMELMVCFEKRKMGVIIQE